jgi:hypothetical protein
MNKLANGLPNKTRVEIIVEQITAIDDLSDFPVSDYYKDKIREARTINRSGTWWAAILLIEDPNTNEPFLAFYRWQKRDGKWKVRSSFNCRSKKDADLIVRFVNELSEKL